MSEEGLTSRCGTCGAEESCEAWEQVVNGRLAWTVTGRCPACPGDAVWEECGWDRTPPGVRAALLERHGTFRLRVTPSAGWSRMELLRSLRADGAEIADVTALADRVLAGEATGTEGEMELLAHRIRIAGLTSVVTHL